MNNYVSYFESFVILKNLGFGTISEALSLLLLQPGTQHLTILEINPNLWQMNCFHLFVDMTDSHYLLDFFSKVSSLLRFFCKCSSQLWQLGAQIMHWYLLSLTLLDRWDQPMPSDTTTNSLSCFFCPETAMDKTDDDGGWYNTLLFDVACKQHAHNKLGWHQHMGIGVGWCTCRATDPMNRGKIQILSK